MIDENISEYPNYKIKSKLKRLNLILIITILCMYIALFLALKALCIENLLNHQRASTWMMQRQPQ